MAMAMATGTGITGTGIGTGAIGTGIGVGGGTTGIAIGTVTTGGNEKRRYRAAMLFA